jgi:hypothetical protein
MEGACHLRKELCRRTDVQVTYPLSEMVGLEVFWFSDILGFFGIFVYT